MSKPSDLVQGTLDLLLLKILALEALNGWAISQRLKQVSGDVLQVSDGSLYPALHKLEQEGWITAEWKASENNRRAKFYSLTRLGRRQLQKETANWTRLSDAITQVVAARGGMSHAHRTLALLRAPAATFPFPPPTASSRSSTKSCSITWNARSRSTARRAWRPSKRARPPCAPWTASPSAKRSAATCGA